MGSARKVDSTLSRRRRGRGDRAVSVVRREPAGSAGGAAGYARRSTVTQRVGCLGWQGRRWQLCTLPCVASVSVPPVAWWALCVETPGRRTAERCLYVCAWRGEWSGRSALRGCRTPLSLSGTARVLGGNVRQRLVGMRFQKEQVSQIVGDDFLASCGSLATGHRGCSCA